METSRLEGRTREQQGAEVGSAPTALACLIAKARAEELAERAERDRPAEPTVGERWAQLERARTAGDSPDGQGGVGA
jgi:hypothetical protein